MICKHEFKVVNQFPLLKRPYSGLFSQYNNPVIGEIYVTLCPKCGLMKKIKLLD